MAKATMGAASERVGVRVQESHERLRRRDVELQRFVTAYIFDRN
jgi:hypothetical protein